MQQVKDSTSTEHDSVCAVSYCELKDGGFAALSNNDAKRLLQCVRMLEKTAVGKLASDAVVQRALTEEQYSDYLKSFDVDFSHVETEEHGEMPWQLREYFAKVCEGDMHTRTANMFKHSKKRDGNGDTAHTRYVRKAEGCYEAAVMLLINTVDLNVTRNPNVDSKVSGEILRWLDRDVNAEPGYEPDASAQGVPRMRGTKSKYTQVDVAPNVGVRRRKFWRQREAVTQAAVQLIYDEVEEVQMTDEQRQRASVKLNKLLQLNDEDDLF
jgi:hypothetical protein